MHKNVLYTDAHCSMVCNTEKLESTYISIRSELLKRAQHNTMQPWLTDLYILTRKGDQNISFKNK